MSDPESSRLVYACYADFLAADPRRRGNALELGIDWRDRGGRYRACWYQDTGELTLERLSPSDRLDLEDFHTGISGPVEILRHVPTRQELSALLGAWPSIAPGEPRTVKRLRELIACEAANVVGLTRARRGR